jgi:SOS-response transcriptional repressor LexA
MKPILSQQVKRGTELKEWESAEHQATMAGVNDFWKRQQERMARVQANAAEAKSKVQIIKQRRPA